MIWAKAEKKRLFHRPRMAMMTLYTVGLCMLSLAAFAGEPTAGDYRITLDEVEQLIAEELMLQDAGDDIEATVIGRRSTEIIRRSVPVAMKVVDLQMDAENRRFRAVLGFASEAGVDRPAEHIGRLTMAGRYDEMVEIPTVKFRLNSGDIIREKDIAWQKMPASRVDRNTVREAALLVGKSPVRGITAGRAIEHDEIEHPAVVVRRTPVHMQYSTKNINISALGTAMQDGAVGQKIKVRNDDSGVIIDARVVDRGRVEVTAPIVIN